MLNKKTAIYIAGFFGFLSIAIGAFGAHSLQDKISEPMISTFKTGSLYHLIHSVVLFVLAFHFEKKLKAAFSFFTIGIVLFSFSLYIYSISGLKIFAIITPLGGVSFLIGWILIIIYGMKFNK